MLFFFYYLLTSKHFLHQLDLNSCWRDVAECNKEPSLEPLNNHCKKSLPQSLQPRIIPTQLKHDDFRHALIALQQNLTEQIPHCLSPPLQVQLRIFWSRALALPRETTLNTKYFPIFVVLYLPFNLALFPAICGGFPKCGIRSMLLPSR